MSGHGKPMMRLRERHHEPVFLNALIDEDFDDVEGAELEITEAVNAHGSIALAVTTDAPSSWWGRGGIRSDV